MAQDPYKYFRPEAREIVEQFSRDILDLEKGGGDEAAVQKLLRLAHTLKGAARVVKQTEIANRAHAIEDTLSPLRGAPIGRETIDAVLVHLNSINGMLNSLSVIDEAAATTPGRTVGEEAPRTIRADLAEADAVLDGIAETHALVNGLRAAVQTVQQSAQLADLLLAQFSVYETKEHDRRAAPTSSRRYVMAEDLRRRIGGVERNLGSVVDQLDRELRQLRETAERLRLVPARSLFTPLERIARDTARAQGKQVAFSGSDGGIRLDAHALDTLQRALVQIVRNAVAHGIETADERSKAGKPPAGHVTVSVFRRGRRIVFACRDDGQGIDVDAVRQAAVQRGLAAPLTRQSGPDDIVRMLLRGGISTSRIVTEESGRGIGLDVVREAVGRLGGEVACKSVRGAGTTFEIVIPPSLSSMDALLAQAGTNGDTVAIPLDAVRSTRRLTDKDITVTAAGASVLHEDKAIAFAPLSFALDGAAWPTERNWAAVIVAGTEGLAAIGVERLLGTGKIVVRPLPAHMAASPIVVAASLDSSGNPQLILDPDGLVAGARRRALGPRDTNIEKKPVLVVDDSLTTRMLEQSILESAGYVVDTAVSGEEALERVREKRYAVILVDVEMPGMDGFAFIERLRADTKTRDIPAILVTSLAAPEHRTRGKAVGAQGYIVKSEFDQAELLSMIQPMMAA